jgi:hypothetical protein
MKESISFAGNQLCPVIFCSPSHEKKIRFNGTAAFRQDTKIFLQYNQKSHYLTLIRFRGKNIRENNTRFRDVCVRVQITDYVMAKLFCLCTHSIMY